MSRPVPSRRVPSGLFLSILVKSRHVLSFYGAHPMEKSVLCPECGKRIIIGGRVETYVKKTTRCWPQFNEWTMLVPLKVDTDVISLDEVTELLNIGGYCSGIGCGRPGYLGSGGGGDFGRFKAELVSRFK